MTGTREPQQDGSIQAMLRDSGLEASTELRSSLEELRALVPDRAPAPRADLAALLAAGAPGFSAHRFFRRNFRRRFLRNDDDGDARRRVRSGPLRRKRCRPASRASPSAAAGSAGWRSSVAPSWVP